MRMLLCFCLLFLLRGSECAFLTSLGSAPEMEYCGCDLDPKFGTAVGWKTTEIWVDVIIILDTSEAMGQQSLNTATTLIDSLVGDSSSDALVTDIFAQFYTRVGVIAMSDVAEVLYSLNMTNVDKVNGRVNIKKGVAQINVDTAVMNAEKMFYSEARNDRENTRKVIYFMTGSAPFGLQKNANQFKASQGIIIVNNFINKDETEHPGLEQLASVGYYAKALGQMETIQLFCKANCYCLPGKDAYKGPGTDPAVKATAGCFYSNPMSIPWNLSTTTCAQLGNGGRLASIHDPNKLEFVQQMLTFDPNANYLWIGYSKSDDGTWQWEDKSSNPYTHWDTANGEPSPTAVSKCAYVDATTSDLYWGAANCNVAFPSVCEFPPCMPGNRC